MMRQRCHQIGMSVFLAVSLMSAGVAIAAEDLSMEQVREYLTKPYHHVLMRHAYAPGTGDPENFMLGECFTQRNLNSGGRSQAMDIGEQLKTAGVKFDRIYSSQWCRCRETAQLLKLGEVEELPAISSSWQRSAKYKASQTAKLKTFLTEMPADDTGLFVTHQGNILHFTGEGLASGQAVVIEYRDNTLKVLGKF